MYMYNIPMVSVSVAKNGKQTVSVPTKDGVICSIDVSQEDADRFVKERALMGKNMVKRVLSFMMAPFILGTAIGAAIYRPDRFTGAAYGSIIGSIAGSLAGVVTLFSDTKKIQKHCDEFIKNNQ